MTSLADHQSTSYAKILYLGDSSTGKTGSLASLVAAGYKLRILDFDNGLDVLRQFILHDSPDKIGNVDFITLRDKYEATPLGPKCKRPKAFVESLKLMESWSDETDPAEWGPDTIFVLDSTTSFAKAAFEWARGMHPEMRDARQWYFAAQQQFENTLALLTSEAFHANVIIIAHISYKETQEGITKGYPSAVGSALGPLIPRYFNTMIQAETKGSGKNLSRRIRLVPSAVVDLKNPAPFDLEDELPLESGLATLFAKLRGSSPQHTP